MLACRRGEHARLASAGVDALAAGTAQKGLAGQALTSRTLTGLKMHQQLAARANHP